MDSIDTISINKQPIEVYEDVEIQVDTETGVDFARFNDIIAQQSINVPLEPHDANYYPENRVTLGNNINNLTVVVVAPQGFYHVDKDGDIDAVVTLRNAGTYLCINEGSGSWTVSRIDGTYGWQVIIGDFNKDDNLDIMIATEWS